MAKLICRGAQHCVYKKNANGVNVCTKFTEKSQCIHAHTIDEMKSSVEEA